MAYIDDVRIDRDDLEGEWLKQAELICNYGTQLVEKVSELNKLKDKIELFAAERDGEIRDNPYETVGRQKVTEGAIKAEIYKDPTHKDLKSQINEVTTDMEFAKVMVKSLEAKAKALEYVTKLKLYIEKTVS